MSEERETSVDFRGDKIRLWENVINFRFSRHKIIYAFAIEVTKFL